MNTVSKAWLIGIRPFADEAVHTNTRRSSMPSHTTLGAGVRSEQALKLPWLR